MATRTYATNVVSQSQRGPGRSADRYIHFGHWDTPPVAASIGASFLEAQERYNDRIVEIARLADALAVLDVGCGFGGTIGAIDARYRGMTLVGINVDAAQLAIASTRTAVHPDNTIAWLEDDASELAAFADQRFDRILAVESIVHLASRRGFLASAWRVLKPGGRLALSDFVATSELRRLRARGGIPFAVDHLVHHGLAPWPDFWGDDGDYEVLAPAASLRLETYVDATVETLPSYRAILGTELEIEHDPRREGMRLLQWLQTRGLIRLVYAGFVKG